MIDAGCNYDRLKGKMDWLDLDPAKIQHILITHDLEASYDGYDESGDTEEKAQGAKLAILEYRKKGI